MKGQQQSGGEQYHGSGSSFSQANCGHFFFIAESALFANNPSVAAWQDFLHKQLPLLLFPYYIRKERAALILEMLNVLRHRCKYSSV
jgi:hypothetical protein